MQVAKHVAAACKALNLRSYTFHFRDTLDRRDGLFHKDRSVWKVLCNLKVDIFPWIGGAPSIWGQSAHCQAGVDMDVSEVQNTRQALTHCGYWSCLSPCAASCMSTKTLVLAQAVRTSSPCVHLPSIRACANSELRSTKPTTLRRGPRIFSMRRVWFHGPSVEPG